MDLVLVSDNSYLIEAIDDTLPLITYEKKKAKKQKLNPSSFASMDEDASIYIEIYNIN